jgi:protein transport protein SEC61 subunit gamma-like protein
MENVKEFAEYAKPKSTQRAIDGSHVYSMPAEFLKEGTLFMNRCTSMAHSSTSRYFPDTLLMVCRARQEGIHPHLASSRNRFLDHGSVIMAQVISFHRTPLTVTTGVIGYIVKLIHIPVNNILVGGS